MPRPPGRRRGPVRRPSSRAAPGGGTSCRRPSRGRGRGGGGLRAPGAAAPRGRARGRACRACRAAYGTSMATSPRKAGSPAGNERTSVGRSIFRNSRFRRRIRASPQRRTETEARPRGAAAARTASVHAATRRAEGPLRTADVTSARERMRGRGARERAPCWRVVGHGRLTPLPRRRGPGPGRRGPAGRSRRCRRRSRSPGRPGASRRRGGRTG